MTETTRFLPPLDTREAIFDYLDGYSVETSDQLVERKLGRDLVKSYMLETSAAAEDRHSAESIFTRAGLDLTPIETDKLYRVKDPILGGDVALLEVVDERYPVLYTTLPTRDSEPWVKRLVGSSPWLDRLWISAPMFQDLWRHVTASTNPRRYTRLSFAYQARYEVPEGAAPTEESFDSSEEAPEEDLAVDQSNDFETKQSRFTMVDRIATIQQRLPTLQETYQPLYSITQLRIPSPSRGGHDFYSDGRVTNRSDSFTDHRANVNYVVEKYKASTESAEQALWVGTDDDGQFQASSVFIEFSEPLDRLTFERWIAAIFKSRRNVFRLSGSPISIGPTKTHVYGIDRHLWQPVSIEFTERHIVALLPQGTCGNTVHRLVTNVQHFVDPAVSVWVGSRPYEALIRETANV